MAPIKSGSTPEMADIAAIQNRVAVALAKRERLIISWTASSSRSRPPPKTQKELDEEDADLFRIEPFNLGLGAPIPKEFLNSDIRRGESLGNDNLKRLLIGKKGSIQASKPRETNEKSRGIKRSLREESTDEEEGRSGLGKAKKSKTGADWTMKPPITRGGIKALKDVKSDTQEEIKPVFRNSVPPSSDLQPQRGGEPQSKVVVAPQTRLVDYSSDDGNEGELADQAMMRTALQKEVFKNSHTCDNPEDSFNPPSKTLSKSASEIRSKSSSKSSKTSSESEQSDLEIAIPMALAKNVTVSVSAAKSSPLAEAKRAKKKQKRARRKEREQLQKTLAQGQAAGMIQTQAMASTSGLGISKKLKDRLLDANGN